jgi:cellulose synthase/poly-beta-1,6-N-acetylglucosamine synthase-like glycosyltransferase
MPKVSIIVPCYNEQSTIRLLLNAIYLQRFAREEMEVIIAEGMSTDDTRLELAAFLEEHADLAIRVVDNTQRIIPAGLNRALEAAAGEFIVRLDAHSVPDKMYVMHSVAGVKAGLGDNVGGVWHIQPGAAGWVAESIAVAAGHPLGVGGALYRYATTAAEVDTVPFGAFRRSLLDEVGMFDETLLTNEDYEFNTRIRLNGGKIWLNPEIHSVYFARETFGKLARQYFRYGFWKWRMLKRYPDTVRWRQALPPIFVLSLIVLATTALFWPLAGRLLGLEILTYFAVLVLGTGPLAVKHRKPYFLVSVPLAIAVMHLCWGSGFLISIVSRSSKS